MKKEDWQIHLLIFLGSVYLCIIGFNSATSVYSNVSEAINLSAIAKSIIGSALFLIGGLGILLQYYLFVKYRNK